MNWYYFSPYYGGYSSLDRYFLKYNPFLHLNTFLLGNWFGLVYRKIKDKNTSNHDWTIFGLVVFNILSIYFTRNLFIHNGLLSIGFGIFLLFLSLNTGRITRIMNNKYLIYLGDISFAMYLFQNPVFIFCKKLYKLIGLSEPYILFCCSFTILLITAHITYRFIEIPMKEFIKKKYYKTS